MNMHRWIQRSLPAVVTAGLAVASTGQIASAQWDRQNQDRYGEELFEWNGSVDREVQVVMRGNQVWTNRIGQTEPRNQRSRTNRALPRQGGQVVVRVENGRGDVDVVQQPSAQNGYTTVVRIRDPRSGSDRYRVTAYWEGYSNGDYGRNRGRANGRDANGHDRDRDGIDDRDEIYRRRDPDNDGRYGRSGYQSLLHWSGNVDNEIEIRIQNGRAETRTLSGAQPTSIRVSAGNSTVPRSDAQINVMQNQGRGTVSVVQQPSQWNNYTTVVRIRDPQGGYGYYDFDLTWR
jgi:hypothetical protein